MSTTLGARWLDSGGMLRLRTTTWLPVLFALGLAAVSVVAIKRFYAHANAESLAWILSPTVNVLNVIHGGFDFVPSEGWVNHARTFRVVPACGGLNFLAVALASLMVLRQPWRTWPRYLPTRRAF